MLDISWSELLFVAVVAIIVIGPKDLPRALRTVGQWTGRARRMAGDFQRQFNEAIREAELDSVKDEVTKIGKIDPVGSVRKEFSKIEAGIKDDVDKAGKGKANGKAEPKADGEVDADADAATEEPKPAKAAAKSKPAADDKAATAPTSAELANPDVSPDAEAHEKKPVEAAKPAGEPEPVAAAPQKVAAGEAKS